MRPSRWYVLALVALTIVSVSCARFSRRGAPAPPPAIVDYGKDLSFSPPPKPGDGTGRLTIFVLEEETNIPIEGAIVRYSGETDGQIVTGADGRASKKVPTGDYRVDLPPCGDSVLVTTAAEADVSVVLDTESGGFLATTWERRFVPAPSVRASEPPPWATNEQIELAIRLEDRCDFSPAEGRNASGWGWTSSGPLGFTQQPGTRAGSDGYITVTIRCTGSGNGEVVIYDTADPSRRIDLLQATSGPPPGETYCA